MCTISTHCFQEHIKYHLESVQEQITPQEKNHIRILLYLALTFSDNSQSSLATSQVNYPLQAASTSTQKTTGCPFQSLAPAVS